MKGLDIKKALRLAKPVHKTKVLSRIRFSGKAEEDLPINEGDVDDCTRFWRRMVVKAFQERTITVHEDWVKLSEFKKWWDRHHEEGLVPSYVVATRNATKFHGPETLLFVREVVNKFFKLPLHVINQNKKLECLPGVKCRPAHDRMWEAYFRGVTLRKRLGCFDTEMEAHLCWLERNAREIDKLIESEPDEYVIEVLTKRRDFIADAIVDGKVLEFI